jgi:flagella basal body P-ring formation protein FlgA
VILMRFLALLLLSAAATTASPWAQAATLRTVTTLNTAVVRLSDLFDDAGPNAARVLGPGPTPGTRIVVESAQLAAIARQYGVAWKPDSPADRTVLDRPGKPLPRETVIEAVRAALAGAGVPAESEIELPGLSPPLVPFESLARPVITQLDYDGATSNFVATLSIGDAAMAPIQMRLVGHARETAAVVVPIRRVLPGEILRAGDLRPARVRTASLRADVARDAEDVIGLTPRFPLPAGQPMLRADLSQPPSVRKGASVLMLLESNGLSLAAQGQALESGAPGERVRVRNPSSRAILETVVIGPDRVRVTPDSLPLQTAASAAGAQLARQ